MKTTSCIALQCTKLSHTVGVCHFSLSTLEVKWLGQHKDKYWKGAIEFYIRCNKLQTFNQPPNLYDGLISQHAWFRATFKKRVYRVPFLGYLVFSSDLALGKLVSNSMFTPSLPVLVQGFLSRCDINGFHEKNSCLVGTMAQKFPMITLVLSGV